MKKIMKFFAIAVVFAVMGTACSKDQAAKNSTAAEENIEGKVLYDSARYLTGFSAKMEQTKASLDDGSGKFSWTDGDVVKVIRSDGESANYSYNESQSAFEPVGDPLEKNGSDMQAFFPADVFVWETDHVKFTMPNAFESLTGIMNPMAALVPADATSETSITLKNLGGIYEVKLSTGKPLGETVTKVELGNTGVKITGSATVSFDGDTPKIGALDGDMAVTLEFATPVTLTSTPKSVYFFLPVTAENAVTGMYVKTVFGKTVSAVTYEPYEQRTRNTPMTITRSGRWYMNFAVNGFFSGGDGLSEATAYQISSVADFKAIKGKMESTADADGYVSGTGTFFGSTGVYYKQTADIDFESNDITANMIGTDTTPFKGTYDGNGSELKNVSIAATANFAGVFSYVDGGTIKKLSVSGIISSTADYVGSIVGRMEYGTISGCASSVTIDASESMRVGGIVGYMEDGIIGSSDGTPTSTDEGIAFSANGCVNTGAVNGKQNVGGIVGHMVKGLVSICRNAANVTAALYNAGGVVGYMQGGTIRLCYSNNAITISGLAQIGGLAGYASSSSPIVIINCSSKSKVLSTDYDNSYYGAAGGLVGRMYSNTHNCVLANSVAWASDVINTKDASAYVGGIVGRITGANLKSIVRNCYSMHNGAAGSSNCRVGIKIGEAELTFGTNCGGIFGYLDKGEVDDCYWTKHNLVQSAGKETSTAANKSITNMKDMPNAAKNGTATFTTSENYKNGRAKGEQYLFEHLRRGAFKTSSGNVLFSYTGYTTETSCAWGKKITYNTSASNGDNAIPAAIAYLPMGADGWWQ